jgi:phosphatidate cytidylyltransferase
MSAPRARRSRSRSRTRGRQRRNTGSDLLLRILVAIPAVAYAIFIIASGGWVFTIGILVLGLVCLHELFRMYDTVRPIKLAAFVALAGLALAAQEGSERQVLLALVAFVPLMFLLGMAMPRDEGPSLTAAMSLTTFGVVWVGMAIAHAVLLRELPHGGGLVVAVLLGTFIGDTGAYLGGRLFGTRKLAPRISPNKTWEGLIAGVLFATFAVWWYGLSSEWMGGRNGAILGVAIALAAPLGDLLESAVKRDAGTKDAGALFGAHGGALDRLDAAFFTLVTGYYVWLALL